MNSLTVDVRETPACQIQRVKTVDRIENIRQPILDLLILEHDLAVSRDWRRLQEVAEQMAHAARILHLESKVDAAGVVRR